MPPNSTKRVRLAGGPFVDPIVYRWIKFESEASGLSIGEIIDALYGSRDPENYAEIKQITISEKDNNDHQ